MSKLLRAGFRRLYTNRVFLFFIIIQFGFGLLLGLLGDGALSLEQVFFGDPLLLALLLSAFCGLFIGTEYSDGTLRNKFIVGHSRKAVYFSNFVLASVAGLLFCLSFLIAVFASGIWRYGFFKLPFAYIGLLCLAMTLSIVALSALLTMICMLVSNKASASVCCILLTIVLLFCGIMCVSALEEPEYISDFAYSVGGEGIQELGLKPNPLYLSGNTREIVQALCDIQPLGQALQLTAQKIEYPPRLPIYSLVLTALLSGLGFALFKRKDLK